MNLKSIRKSLNDNKIFFEIILGGLLSFMAIYVSIQANKIAETQTKIMEQESLPQLEIRSSQLYNASSRTYDNKVWYFFNRGGKLSDFEIEHCSFLNFTKSVNGNYESSDFPLYDYFNMRGTLTGESEGLIYELDNNFHGEKEIELRRNLINEGFFEVNSYALVSYIDIFDNKHIEYFQINPSIHKISDKEWYKKKDQFHKNKKLEFPILKASDILK